MAGAGEGGGGGCGLYAGLLPPLGSMVRGWLAEDIPSFDYGGAVVGDKPESMTLFCKAPVSDGDTLPLAQGLADCSNSAVQDLAVPPRRI